MARHRNMRYEYDEDDYYDDDYYGYDEDGYEEGGYYEEPTATSGSQKKKKKKAAAAAAAGTTTTTTKPGAKPPGAGTTAKPTTTTTAKPAAATAAKPAAAKASSTTTATKTAAKPDEKKTTATKTTTATGKTMTGLPKEATTGKTGLEKDVKKLQISKPTEGKGKGLVDPDEEPQDSSDDEKKEKKEMKSKAPPPVSAADKEKHSKRLKQQQELLDSEKKKDTKERLNLVVVGHVDAGKSTLMGHLLYKLGMVSQAIMHKYEKESRLMGKPSFHFAWVLDENVEERSRGITVDVAVNYFETAKKKVTLLDAPGHRDFIPNMIGGAAQADAAVLVVPASRGEFESGFSEDGQTKEHAVLVKSLGVNQIIVAVNKLDTVDWSQTRYNSIANEMKNFLKTVGFSPQNVWPVPVSGLQGINISDQKEPKLTAWYKGPTLVELIDQFSLPERALDKPFRMSISNVYKSMSIGTTVCGKIEAGAVLPKDKVLIAPLNEVVTVKGVEIRGKSVTIGSAGDNVDVGLRDVSDPNVLSVGQVLCDPNFPIPLISRFKAQVITLTFKAPILKGSEAILFTTTSQQPCVITRLYKLLDKSSGKLLKKKPRNLPVNTSAIVEIQTRRPIPLELYQEYRQLGRFQIRRATETLAIGIVMKIYYDA